MKPNYNPLKNSHSWFVRLDLNQQVVRAELFTGSNSDRLMASAGLVFDKDPWVFMPKEDDPGYQAACARLDLGLVPLAPINHEDQTNQEGSTNE